MNVQVAASLIASVGCLTVGMFVYTRERKNPLNQSFALITGLAGIWTSFPFLASLPQAERTALVLARSIYIFASFVPTAFFHFVLVVLHLDRERGEQRIRKLFLLASIIFAATSFHPYFIQGVVRDHTFLVIIPGPQYAVFVLFMVLGSGYTFYWCFKGYLRSSGSKRNQLKYLIVSFAFAHTGAAIHFLGNYLQAEPFPHDIFLIVFAGIITYAIVTHQLMDITIVVEKGLTYTVLLLLMGVPIFLILLWVQRFFFGTTSYGFSAVFLVLMFVTAIGLDKAKPRAKSVITRTLFPSRYETYQTLTEFSRVLVTILDLKQLQEQIISTLSHAFGAEEVSLYFLDQEKQHYVHVVSHGVDAGKMDGMRVPQDDYLPRLLLAERKVIVKDELEREPFDPDVMALREKLAMMQVEVCIPLINKDRLVAFCHLGCKRRQAMYTHEDVQLLTALARNAAIALDNALLYEDLRHQKSLMQRMDRLRSLETIAGGFAHEVRNPLTSIKTFIELAPERRDDSELFGPFREVVIEDIHRIERLIHEILDYARYGEPRFAEENLNAVVESSLYFLRLKADEHGTKIEKDLCNDLTFISVDRQQIMQVLLNLFLNALEAMPNGGTLTVKTHTLIKQDGRPWAQIEVRDTGYGISKEDLDHIFDPFFTTKHESQEREGTGLGLTIVHQIVREHHGCVGVESAPGAGTTFFVSLPLNPLAQKQTKQRVRLL